MDYGVEWIYPNTSELNRSGSRGGLAERNRLRSDNGFDLVEMPGDYVKNISEVRRTGLELCSPFLVREHVSDIYVRNASTPVRYSLHTEPALPRTASGYPARTAELRWFDSAWVDEFWRHVTGIVEYLDIVPEIIEVHPGYRPNTPKTVASGVASLVTRWGQRYGRTPLFLLENRTGQVISTGKNLARYWNEVLDLPQEISEHLGVVLDFSQLYTTVKSRFYSELDCITPESVKGFHIHWRHSRPGLNNPLDWRQAFSFMNATLRIHEIYLLPEVMQKNAVEPTKAFCEELLLQ